jgi:CubicO group peptidase (beta-lactamase class C family)
MRDVLGGYTERGEVPGLVALISRRGEVSVDAVGVRTAGSNEAIHRDTIFRIASMTKPITAAATMLLVEECKLRLDEPVDPILPELSGRRVLKQIDGPLDDTVPAHRPITVRDLLTFRMGFGLLFAPPTFAIVKALGEQGLAPGPPRPSTSPPPDEWMRRLGSLPLMYQPGERWMYNTGSEVLSVLIARASGQTFDAFLRERLFEPLDMRDTDFSVPADKLDRFTTSYWTNPQTGAFDVFDPIDDSDWSRGPAFPSGAGGLVSTADDFLAFAQMLMDGGRHGSRRILSRPSVELMTTDQLTPEQKAKSGFGPGFFDSSGWGFGVGIITRRTDLASVGSYGWNGGLGSLWGSDPREQMITILLTNRGLESPTPPGVFVDFQTSAYAAIGD